MTILGFTFSFRSKLFQKIQNSQNQKRQKPTNSNVFSYFLLFYEKQHKYTHFWISSTNIFFARVFLFYVVFLSGYFHFHILLLQTFSEPPPPLPPQEKGQRQGMNECAYTLHNNKRAHSAEPGNTEVNEGKKVFHGGSWLFTPNTRAHGSRMKASRQLSVPKTNICTYIHTYVAAIHSFGQWCMD